MRFLNRGVLASEAHAQEVADAESLGASDEGNLVERNLLDFVLPRIINPAAAILCGLGKFRVQGQTVDRAIPDRRQTSYR